MKMYHVFSGYYDYDKHEGGFKNYCGSFTSFEKAKEYAPSAGTWWQIARTKTDGGLVIVESSSGY